jgi:PhnB protein
MTATTITPYLFYSGKCEEALSYYQKSLGAKIEMVMRFNESPNPTPPGALQEGFENKIMHATFTIAGATIMASDGDSDKPKFDGFRLALTVPTDAEAHRLFDGLAAGGQVQVTLRQTFFSSCYGMVTDKFGVGWIVMVTQANLVNQ